MGLVLCSLGNELNIGSKLGNFDHQTAVMVGSSWMCLPLAETCANI